MRICISLLTFFVTIICFGHEGHQHAEPSKLTSLYGGSLVEASHDHNKSAKHDHVEAAGREFFFEVVYSKEAYKLYWLQLSEGSKTKLELIKDQSKFEILKATQVNPRKKKQRRDLTISRSDNHWTLSPVKIKGKRALIEIEGKFSGESFTGTAQVERR